jgi:hypothetical protein
VSYTVVWKPLAMAKLAELWIAAADRAAFTQAANRIESLLRTNPLEVGESRTDANRVLYELPLAVAYRVSEEDLMVTVVGVRMIV